jgi:hypothetical protein
LVRTPYQSQNFTGADATYNTAVGHAAGTAVTTGVNITLIGGLAGTAITTGDRNTFVGFKAGDSTTTASYNTAMGSYALDVNTTGASNTAVGDASLDANTSGSNNVAIGQGSMTSNTTGESNMAIGYFALGSNVSGNYNISIGQNSGQLATGTGNVFCGYASGANTTSGYNTFAGYAAGNAITTGGKNTILGVYNGNQGSLDIRTSSNNIVLSDGDGNPRLHINGANEVRIPGVYGLTTASSANVFTDAGGYFYRSTSSLRYKNTVNDATHGLTELMTLRPVTYKGNNDGDTVFGGLIAEEVHDAGLTEFVTYNEDNEPDALAYGNMVSLCIKAIQEQQVLIESLTTRITALEG